MTVALPRLAITSGEPAGIGPDICLKLAQHDLPADLLVFADPKLLETRAAQLDLDIKLNLVNGTQPEFTKQPGQINVIPIRLNTAVRAGQLDSANAPYVLKQLSLATEACLHGQVNAIVTAPVHKGIINDAGVSFSGHTEFFAAQTHSKQVVMMLSTPTLSVALATTHLPLRDVSAAITSESLTTTIEILHHDLQCKYAIPQPRILVCGLNPHAGEGGHLGREEIEVIEPVIKTLQAAGMNLIGPVPADTAFTPDNLAKVDVVLSMFHDQGLPVLKAQGFGEAVNVTLGLPIIRTSVDHGTALELAGTGKALETSLIAAVKTALDMVERSQSVPIK